MVVVVVYVVAVGDVVSYDVGVVVVVGVGDTGADVVVCSVIGVVTL